MSRAAAVAAPPAGAVSLSERIRTASTPTRIRGFMYAIWGLSALLLLVGGLMLEGAHVALKTVGNDTAPSIIAAQEISSALADLDANAANYLLGTKVHQDAATAAVEKQRVVVTNGIVAAAKNITYDAEYEPIKKLADQLGRYLELYGQMKYRKDTGDGAGAILIYNSATDLVHQEMLPAAAALDKVNFDSLKAEYAKQRRNSEGAEVIAGLIAAGLAFVLIRAQIFLARKMRRMFNLPLLAATVVTVVFGLYLVTRIAAAREDLRVAKEDAFDSIHALWQARAVAYDANGDESRYLFFVGPRSAAFDQAYKDKVKKLTTMPQPESFIMTALAKLRTDAVPSAYKGYFADELRNITFPGEGPAALEVVRAFAAYDKIDTKIRALELGGKHADAVDLCIGAGDGKSNAAFDRFDAALLKVIEINHTQFKDTIDTGEDALSTAAKMLPLASLLIAVLGLLGLRPRLREYAA